PTPPRRSHSHAQRWRWRRVDTRPNECSLGCWRIDEAVSSSRSIHFSLRNQYHPQNSALWESRIENQTAQSVPTAKILADRRVERLKAVRVATSMVTSVTDGRGDV